MIRSFGYKDTEKVWQGIYSKKLPSGIQDIARRKFRMINNSQDINDLRVPTGNRLGSLKGFHSVRIIGHWRILFRWRSGDVFELEVVDCH